MAQNGVRLPEGFDPVEISKTATDVVMLDNYDSFTWNLYQYLCLLGANVTVIRSEEITLEQLSIRHPNITHLVISPGPGHPTTDSGISVPAIQTYAGKIPIMGICMGLQCICTAYGGVVDSAGEIIHGKTSEVQHDGKGLFKGASQNIACTRYHSLAARIENVPEQLEITSKTKSGVIMGLRHKQFAIESVQYHPESILSEEGMVFMGNFLKLTSGIWKENEGYEDMETQTKNINGASSAVPTILQKIEQQRRLDVAITLSTPGFTQNDLTSLIDLHVAPPLISFHRRLQSPNNMALLAEVKRASPSKGDLVGDNAPSSASIALSYALAGASVISVLTEPKWFKGSLGDMRSVRAAIDTLPNRPAVLRKDFILETYQIDEARVYGADTVLLIVAMLTDEKLRELYEYSLARGMEPLVEVNNPKELSRALDVGARIIGVNNRNLHDFNVDMSTTSRIADVVKERKGSRAEEVILIALSGITGRADVEGYASQGVKGILVGESLMKAPDQPAFVRELLGLQAPYSPVKQAPLVKICGLSTVDAAVTAAQAGADLLGLIFVEKSKRFVTPEQAKPIIATVRAIPSTTTQQTMKLDTTDWFTLQASRLATSPRKKPLFVGVFQNPTLEYVIETVEQLQLDVVQLHGDEPLGLTKFINVPVIKVFHVGSDIVDAQDATREGLHSFVLLDTQLAGRGSLSGGAGKTFDWTVAKKLADSRGEGRPRLPIMVAGGLDSQNVKFCISQADPWAVDVSGGVETNGVKDLEKIKAFVEAAKRA